MSGWILWVVAAGAFGIGEMLTTSFFLAPFAVGAALAAAVDGAGAGGLPAWIVFVVVSLLTLLVMRPIAISHLKVPPQIRTGAAALIGKSAMVLETDRQPRGRRLREDRRRGVDRTGVR